VKEVCLELEYKVWAVGISSQVLLARKLEQLQNEVYCEASRQFGKDNLI
jgi:hypothetical protein